MAYSLRGLVILVVMALLAVFTSAQTDEVIRPAGRKLGILHRNFRRARHIIRDVIIVKALVNRYKRRHNKTAVAAP